MTAEQMSLQVDDDGFVCVVAPDSYEGFVDEEWTLDRLLVHFVEQMNRGSLAELTMAAQFSDESPIASYSQRLSVAPGRSRITLREEVGEDESRFALTVSPASAGEVVEHPSVPWFGYETDNVWQP